MKRERSHFETRFSFWFTLEFGTLQKMTKIQSILYITRWEVFTSEFNRKEA